MIMTSSFDIGSMVMVLAVNLAGPLAVTAQITARISEGISCYFAPRFKKPRVSAGSARLLGCFSADYQPDQSGLALRKA
jgi:hypothetical protein